MLYFNAKENKEIETIIKGCEKHIGEKFNRDLITVEELVDLTIDFIDEIERLKAEISDLKEEYEESIEDAKYRASEFINYERSN